MNLEGVLAGIAAAFSVANTLALGVLIWKGGRWTGIVDTRLAHLEKNLNGGEE